MGLLRVPGLIIVMSPLYPCYVQDVIASMSLEEKDDNILAPGFGENRVLVNHQVTLPCLC